MLENELVDLGIFRIPIPIPFRQAGGPVNAYLVEEERGFLLFDIGIGLERSQAALVEGIERAGHRLEEVNRIILSHGHVDHYGAAAWVLEQIGREVPVLIRNADAMKVLESGLSLPAMLERNRINFARLGMPPQVLAEMVAAISREAGLSRRLTSVTELLPGEKFRCKHVSLEVHAMPGHTPGLCCLYDREHRLLFSADHLLEKVSPNPLIDLRPDGEPSPFKPLVAYFESINRVRALAIDLVLPGHSTPFSSHLEVIDSLSVFYRHRQAKLLDALKKGPQTVYELMTALFPSSSAFELFLMMSETLGNLEALEEKGEIERESGGEFILFRRMGK
jgi:glyoxylase-like metal-dependent hydrolase (beta-lactamase superfamily II)